MALYCRRRRPVRSLRHSSPATPTWIATFFIALISFAIAPDVALGQLRPNTSPREYVVRPGDNLYRIALNNGTTVDEVRRINGLKGTKIEVGQVLLLDAPASDEQSSAAAPSATSQQQAEPEEDAPLFIEAFDEEAASTEANTPATQESTRETPREATPIEASSPMAYTLPPRQLSVEVLIEPISASNAFDVYHAKKDDTFESIGLRLSIAPGLLMALNPDATLPSKAGTPIRLPIEPSSILYRVKDGDTIEDIASWFGTTAETISVENELTGTALRIDQRIRIPIVAAASDAISTATVEVGQHVADGGIALAQPQSGRQPSNDSANEPVGEARGFEAAVVSGRARVYPDQFAGRLMAVGKPYDPKKFTISHATLDLGSVVLLTNEATGRKTFAEVTDRPPAAVDYLADVSKAVADVLGLEPRGSTIRLQVAR